jgi:uncharacterized protein with beta-barrel porin domain
VVHQQKSRNLRPDRSVIRLNVDAGGLTVNGSLAANPLKVNGTLGGNGTIAGPTTMESGSTLSPGNPIGTLTFTGNLILSSNSTVLIEIDKNRGINDRLKVSGPLLCNGTLTVTNLAGTLSAGDHFKIFDVESFNGAFQKMSLPTLAPGLEWNTQDLANGSLSVLAILPK